MSIQDLLRQRVGGFIFGGNTGDSYESLQAKRRSAEGMAAANRGAPRNVGEGLSHLGRAIAYRGLMNQYQRGTKKGEDEFKAQWDAVFGGGAPPAPGTPTAGTFAASGGAVTLQGGQGADMLANAPDSLIRTESGGDWAAQNSEMGAGGKAGHFGRVQFGHARLQDAMSAGAIPQGTTPEQFMASPDLQRAAENWHFSDINNFIDQNGLSQFEGQTVGGVPITRDGMIAMAHLGGSNGMKRFLETGGRYNPSDSFGTSLSDYAQTHAGNTVTGGGGQTVMQGGEARPGGFDPRLVELMSSPYATPGQRAVMQLMLQQQMAPGMSELDRIRLEQERLRLEQMRNPQPDFTMLSPDEVTQMGLPEGAYQRGADGRIYPMSNGPDVVVNNGSEIGSIPQGYELFTDPETGARSMRPIAGGPEDTSSQDARKLGNASIASDVVTTAAQRARDAVSRQDFGSAGTSFVGQLPWTDSAEVLRQVEVLKSQAAAGNLQAMRDASPTGGALGGVSNKEVVLLEAMSGALNPNSPNFLRDLEDYERTLLQTIHGKDAGDAIYDQTRPVQKPPDLEQSIWDSMTPEERELFR